MEIELVDCRFFLVPGGAPSVVDLRLTAKRNRVFIPIHRIGTTAKFSETATWAQTMAKRWTNPHAARLQVRQLARLDSGHLRRVDRTEVTKRA